MALPSGKNRGPDGFPSAFYKQFQDVLAPILDNTFNSISDTCLFPRHSQEAHITLIHIDQKDPFECLSYHPISLNNANILAARFQTVIPIIINLD